MAGSVELRETAAAVTSWSTNRSSSRRMRRRWSSLCLCLCSCLGLWLPALTQDSWLWIWYKLDPVWALYPRKRISQPCDQWPAVWSESVARPPTAPPALCDWTHRSRPRHPTGPDPVKARKQKKKFKHKEEKYKNIHTCGERDRAGRDGDGDGDEVGSREITQNTTHPAEEWKK